MRYFWLAGILVAAQIQAVDLNQEVAKMDLLIQCSEKSLAGEKVLKQQLQAYQEAHQAYYRNMQDNEALLKLVKAGYRLLQSIKEQNLVQTFDPDLISELTVISQVATKKSIPR